MSAKNVPAHGGSTVSILAVARRFGGVAMFATLLLTLSGCPFLVDSQPPDEPLELCVSTERCDSRSPMCEELELDPWQHDALLEVNALYDELRSTVARLYGGTCLQGDWLPDDQVVSMHHRLDALRRVHELQSKIEAIFGVCDERVSVCDSGYPAALAHHAGDRVRACYDVLMLTYVLATHADVLVTRNPSLFPEDARAWLSLYALLDGFTTVRAADIHTPADPCGRGIYEVLAALEPHLHEMLTTTESH